METQGREGLYTLGMVWVLQTFFSSFIKLTGQFLTQPFNQVLLTNCSVKHDSRHSEYRRKPYSLCSQGIQSCNKEAHAEKLTIIKCYIRKSISSHFQHIDQIFIFRLMQKGLNPIWQAELYYLAGA